jgi:hypothetical protein
MPDALRDDGHAVDIVLCIDVTSSMRAVLTEVKEGALSFHTRLESVMAKRGMSVVQMRLRVIAFRDFGADGDDAIERTPFHALPQEAGAFADFVKGLQAVGGGDPPESGLEALAAAVRSPWSGENEENGNRRHIIVVFTDAAAHPLGTHTPGWTHASARPLGLSRLSRRRQDPDRPDDLVPVPGYRGEIYPRSLDELHDQWGRDGRDGALDTVRPLNRGHRSGRVRPGRGHQHDCAESVSRGGPRTGGHFRADEARSVGACVAGSSRPGTHAPLGSQRCLPAHCPNP